MGRKGRIIHKVDFNDLERRAGNYKALNPFEREIIDHMVALSNPAASTGLSAHQMAALDLVYEALAELTPRQQQVLAMTFGLGDDGPMTEHQIAEQLKISQPGVQQLKNRAIRAIQKKVSLNSAVTKTLKKEEK